MVSNLPGAWCRAGTSIRLGFLRQAASTGKFFSFREMQQRSSCTGFGRARVSLSVQAQVPKIPLTSGVVTWDAGVGFNMHARAIYSRWKTWSNNAKEINPRWSEHFGNSRFHSMMATFSFILPLGTFAIQHRAKPSCLSPSSLFPGVHLSTLPCPSAHMAPSHRQQVLN